MNLGISGLASGFDWQSLISQIMQVERSPETRMRNTQTTLQQQNNAYGSIKTEISVLNNRVQTLTDPTLFDSRTTLSSDPTVATATADTGAPVGTYSFNFGSLATAALLNGSSGIAKSLNASNDVSQLLVTSAGFAKPVSTGTFTVNGKQVSINSTDTLQNVFDNISTATGGAVSASYNSSTDRISLTSAGEIVLGSVTDTSNFLQAAKLYNNASGSVTSSSALGGVNVTSTLNQANLTTSINDGGSGAGQFKINGVAISFNASTDSIQNVLDRINNSSAGVTATYDSVQNRFQLTNKQSGDVGVALEDDSGNFLTATGLLSGTLQHGQNLLYSINGGPQLSSQSNTITDTSSGLTGLSVTAIKGNSSATISVSNDTDKIKTAINDFMSEYNKVQSMISTQTASSTDANGKVTAGILAGDSVANEIASKLRSLAYSPDSSRSGAIKSLDDLGIQTNGNDDTLSLTDSTKLDAALSSNLDQVKQLFTDSAKGVAVQLKSYIDSTVGDDGSLALKQNNLTKQSTDIDTQVSDLERRLSDEQTRLTNEFVAMETAQANINQQLQYLQKNLGG